MKLYPIKQRRYVISKDQEVCVGQDWAEIYEGRGFKRTARDKIVFPAGGVFELDFKITRQTIRCNLWFFSSNKFGPYCDMWLHLSEMPDEFELEIKPE